MTDGPVPPGPRPGETTAALGLGSNLGDRLSALRRGWEAVGALPGVRPLDRSGIWETVYVGPGGPQPPYLNACALVATTLAPRALLADLQRIERGCGRPPGTHLQPRCLDLDILLYGDLVLAEPDLVIPHPRLRERAFVLEPLAELAAGWVLPDSGLTVGTVRAIIRAAGGPAVRPLPGGTLAWDGSDG
ncbi:MAG: 2-amino-4-hydroxy-6-hydroxymethyldihydropteridine diphosphokinase [Candidatus Latescibacteria bacterium]|nr:2-amino-4-hydroxy-6-hydroxymethyldihydropteridine diphosphokinase [Candidatus Latescibacterota bacterium]